MLKLRYQILFLAFVVLGIYYPVIFAPYCSTDDVRTMEALLNCDSFPLGSLFFQPSAGQYYRPLLFVTFLADKYLWGLEESFLHLENLLLHLANVLTLFYTARLLFRKWQVQEQGWGPLLVALVFALHPINTEAVDWISGRSDVLAGLFVLLSLLFLVSSLEKGSAALAALSGAALLLGALAKESALCFAPAALFYLLCHDARFGTIRTLRQRALSLAAPAAAIVAGATCYLLMRRHALSGGDKGIASAINVASGHGVDLLSVSRVFTKVAGFYLKKLFMPLPLNFGIVQVSEYYVIVGALLLPLLFYLAWRRTLTSFLSIAAFCICVPSFLVAVSKLSWTPVAERYLYIPCAMFSIMLVGWGIAWYRQRGARLPLTSLLVLILAGSAYATTSRNIIWQDNYTLFADTVAKSPTFNTAKNDLAIAMIRRGEKKEAYNLMKQSPSEKFQLSSLNVANMQIAEGKLVEARKTLYLRLKEDTGYPHEILKLLVKIAELRREQARQPSQKRELDLELKELITRQYNMAHDPFYQYRLGLVYLRLDERRKAFSSFSSAKTDSPAGSHYRGAAVALAEKFRP